jgi:hypothetical protein
MRFTPRNDTIVSVSCGGSAALTFLLRQQLATATSLFIGDDGSAISGTLVSPVNAEGTINIPRCHRVSRRQVVG